MRKFTTNLYALPEDADDIDKLQMAMSMLIGTMNRPMGYAQTNSLIADVEAYYVSMMGIFLKKYLMCLIILRLGVS